MNTNIWRDFQICISVPLNAFQGEIIISCLHVWTDSQVSLAWIEALNKEF